MSLATFLADPSIPDDVKVRALMKTGVPEDRAIQAVIISTPEETYDVVRDVARKVLSHVPGGKTIGDWTIPDDLESAGSAAGSVTGMPFLGPLVGGAVGGMAQGRGVGSSIGHAIPGALLNKFVPAFLQRLMASKIAQSMSNKATSKIAGATKKLFKLLDVSDVPETPEGLHGFYASGQISPAIRRAGAKLDNFRRILRTQPAFARLYVRVPVKTPPAFQGGPVSVGWHQMPMGDAMDYLDQLYNRANSAAGVARGGIQAEPDANMARLVRQEIVKSLQSVRGVGPKVAQTFTDLNHDYGVTKVMSEIFPKAKRADQLLDHEDIYRRLNDQNRLSHLGNLVGEGPAREFQAAVAPRDIRITPSEGGFHFGGGIPGTPLHARGPGVFAPPPTGPQEFKPLNQKIMQATGPALTLGASQVMEKSSGQ